jgi:hypothetical protein
MLQNQADESAQLDKCQRQLRYRDLPSGKTASRLAAREARRKALVEIEGKEEVE